MNYSKKISLKLNDKCYYYCPFKNEVLLVEIKEFKDSYILCNSVFLNDDISFEVINEDILFRSFEECQEAAISRLGNLLKQVDYELAQTLRKLAALKLQNNVGN